MSKQIDERVVEMTFDNKDFEKNVATSMSTIDKLKAALNFRGAEKGLDAVNSAAKKVNLSGISNAVDQVRVKFDALQVAGITALANITNSAINTGKRMASAFTVDPFVQGFNEYETQLNSVQTIMANTASKGTTIDQVTDALNELNTYADKTIYNFTEMTRNIGMFTAAGVDLDKSVASIKGIANLAAMSGSRSIQASTAMYQLSQAIAAGRVSLMDWNSVVNAGMGGEQFQEALKRTARVMGTGVDAAIEKYGSFRESLTQGQWLTTDVLTETLKQISGAYSEAELMQQGYSQEQAKAITNMAVTAEEAATKVKTFTQLIDTMKEAVGSGWAQTWQTVFGDFYEARDFWTSISDMFGDMIGNMSDARNTLLEGAFNSNWDQLRGKIEDAGGSWDKFQETVKQTARDHGIAVDEMINSETTLFDLIQNGTISTGIVGEAFGKFIDDLAGTVGATDEATQSLQNFHDVVNQVIMGDFGNGQARVEALTKAGYDYATVQDLVNKTLAGQAVNYEKLSDAQLQNMGYTEEQVEAIRDLQKQAHETGSTIDELIKNMARPSGRELMFSSIKNLLEAIIRPAQAVRQAFSDIFGLNSDQIYNFIAAFEHFTSSLVMAPENVDKLRRTFKGLFAIISIVTNFIGGGLSAAFQIIQTVLDHFDLGILDATAGLGDMLTAFSDFVNSHNIFTAAIQVISNVIINAIIAIQDFINMVRESEIISFIAFNISKAFEGIKTAIEGIAGKGMELLGKFVDLIMGLSEMSFDEIIQAFRDFGSEVFNYLVTSFSEIADPIQTAISNIASFASEKFGWLIDILIRVKDTVVDVVSTIIERFSGTGLAGVFAIVFSAGTLALISKFISVFSKLASPIETAIGLIDSLKTSFEKYAKAKAFNEMSEGIRNIAISIGIMAAAVVALAQLQPEQLMNASIAVGALAVALIAITGALTFLTSKGGFGKLGVGIAAIGAGILMVATSFRVLEGIDEKSMKSSLFAIVSVMGVMTALAIALQRFGGKGDAKEFSGPSLQIVALAAAVAIVANAIKSMSELSQDQMITAVGGMITVFGSLTALMAIMNRFSGGLANASGLLVMVIGLQAFLLVVGQLANFDASGIIANLPSILVLFGMIAGLMAASSLAGANSAKGGVGLVAMSGAMLILTQVINILGSMDPGILQRGTAAVVAIGVIMSLLIAATHLAGDNALKAGGSLIMISVAAMILSGAIALLGSMDPAALARGVAAIAAIGAIFTALIAVTHLAKECQKELIVMTVAIGILVGAVVLLSALDPAKLVPATACLTSLMMAFGGMVALTKFTGKANSGMIVALGAIVILAGVVAALALVMGALTALDVAPSIETAVSMSVMLLTMTAVLAALAAIGPFASMAIPALGALAAVIVGLGALFTAIGALNSFLDGGLADTINKAAPVMQAIGNALGSLIGGFVGGMASGAMSALPDIGLSISQFWMNIQPFVLGMKILGPDALNGVKTLVDMLTAITAGNIFESLSQFLTGGNSMDNFAVNLQKFGMAISAFSMTLTAGKFNGETVTAAANAGKALAEMQSMMQGQGGIFTMFEGVKDMGAFGEQIKAFGEAMVDFSDTVDGNISESAVTAAANAGKAFAELQKAIGPTGGDSVLEFFSGTKDLGDFGAQIKAFGEAMVDFSDTVDEGAIDEDAVKQAKNAGEIMAALEDSIDTTSGGVVGFFAGETNLESFGAQIKAFGEAMVEFSNALVDNGGIDTEAITKAKDAGVAMSDLANALPTYALGSGKLDLTGFGNDLNDYAGSLSSMATTLKSVDLSKISQASGIASKVSDILISLQGVDESVINKFWVLENLGTYLSDFSSDIASLDTTKISTASVAAQRLVDLITSMTGINADSVAGFSSAISALGQVSYDQIYSSFNSVDFSLIGVNVMTRLAQGIQVGAQNVQAQLDIMLSSLGDYASQGTQEFKLAGLRLATEFATGIQNGAQNVQSQVTIMVQNAVNALNGYEGFFYAAGSNLAVGFANGISASSYRAKLAARAMANAAKTAAEEALDEHSPSKVMQQIGEYAGEGFVMGVNSKVGDAEKAGYSISNGLIYATRIAAGVANETADGIESIIDEMTKLSEALDTSTKEESESADEAAENTSKLSEALATAAQSAQDLVDRRADLDAIGEVMAKAGDKISNEFLAELISSSGQYAGAIDEIIKLTDEQLYKINEMYEKSTAIQQASDFADTVSASLLELNKSQKNLNSMSKLFARTGVKFSKSFISEIVSGSGEYADSLQFMANLTDEELQRISDMFEEKNFVDTINEVVSALLEDDGLAGALEASGKTVEEFAKFVSDMDIDVNDALSTISEFADQVSDGFSKMSIKDQTGLAEYADNLRNNMIVAQDWERNVEAVFSKIGNYPGSEKFKKEVLEKGFDKYGRIMAELAGKSVYEIMQLISLWNSAQITGGEAGYGILQSLTPEKEQIVSVGENAATGLTDSMVRGIQAGSEDVNDAVTTLCKTANDIADEYFETESFGSLTKQLVWLLNTLTEGIIDVATAVIDSMNRLLSYAESAAAQAATISEAVSQLGSGIQQVSDPEAIQAKADILNAAGSAGASSSVSNTINVVDNVSKNSFDNISTMSKMQSSIDNLANKISELDTSNAGTFVQNNYSPKALSTATIYRQTKNQISLARNKPNSGFTR